MPKTLKDFDFKSKRVFLRCDFNVPLDEKGNVEDDFRIKETLPTIEYLVKKGAKLILASHLGSPEGRVREELKLTPVQEKLINYLKLPVMRVPGCIGRKIERQTLDMKEGEVLLLENLRFYKEEEENDSDFSKELSKLADIYIDDAFGVSHRAHASIVGVSQYLPSAMGFLFEKEIRALSRVLKKPWHPLVAIVGGVKISTKIKLIKQFLETADHLLLGGKIANIIFQVKGISIGRPWPEEKTAREIEKINLTSTKLHLPVDAVVSPDKTGKVYVRESAPGKVRNDEMLLDIGPETIAVFSKIIRSAKMIVWSGPLGFFEEPFFEKGTKEVAREIVRNHRAFKICGGGETLFALSKFGLRDRFDHVSTGGGAMLHFLSGEELPGLKALEE